MDTNPQSIIPKEVKPVEKEYIRSLGNFLEKGKTIETESIFMVACARGGSKDPL